MNGLHLFSAFYTIGGCYRARCHTPHEEHFRDKGRAQAYVKDKRAGFKPTTVFGCWATHFSSCGTVLDCHTSFSILKRVDCPLQVGGKPMPQMKEFKYLGVLFQVRGLHAWTLGIVQGFTPFTVPMQALSFLTAPSEYVLTSAQQACFGLICQTKTELMCVFTE